MVILFVVVAPVQFVGIHFTVLRQGNEEPIYLTSWAYYQDTTLS